MDSKRILVTGGAGYIGSHTLLELIKAGYTPVVVDNLDNASKKSIEVAERLTGTSIEFYQVDLRDSPAMRTVFESGVFYAVIHFAGLKAVGESVQDPLKYYSNNLTGTITLLQLMREYNVKNILFSSSCTVYGEPEYLPVDEKHPVGNCTNPYGRTKYFIEQIFTDLTKAEKDWKVVFLRYFNPVSAHESGDLGEDPNGIPNQLMPYIAQVAVGRRNELLVFGDDYDTKDGTGVRDYLHVVDLARAHTMALSRFEYDGSLWVYNLGTGTGYSVMEMIKVFEKAADKKIPYKIVARRPGDATAIYADPSLAEKDLGWKAEFGLNDMCVDLWRWQSKHPNGYTD